MTTHVAFETGAEQGRARREPTTVVADIMTPRVHACRATDTLEHAARLMWDHDCGAIPIVDARGRAIGMITDRDVCMAAYIQGRPLGQIPVTVAGARRIHSVRPDASLAVAQETMKMHRVRRLAVIDLGGNLVGMLSLADIARVARSSRDPRDPLHVEQVASTLAEVFRSHAPRPAGS